MRRCFLAAAAVTIIAGICASASAQRRTDSEYDKLDPGRLSQVLTDMGMTELLRTLVDEQGGQESPEAKMQLAQLKINEAERQANLEVRNQMLDQAITLLQDVATSLQAKADELTKAVEDEEKYTPAVREADKAVLESFKARFRVLEVMGVSRTERYAARLIFLRGGDADRKAILHLTEEVVKPLRDLNTDIENTRDQWSRRCRSEREMVVMPKLMDIQRRASYRSAWMNYYRGLAMTGSSDPNEEKARKGFFYEAQTMVDQFARGSDDFGVKYWAIILYGMASRELGQYEVADEFFRKAMGLNAPDDIRARALFELAETAIAQAKSLHDDTSKKATPSDIDGSFKTAKQAVDDYSKKAPELLGKTYEPEVVLNTAMLGSHLYETWADCVNNTEQAAKLREQAQDSLMAFLDKFDSPDIRGAFFQIIANKYRDREDYDKLNSMILLAIAEDKTGKDKPSTEELDLGEKLLKIILGRKDETSKKVRPQAMFSMAVIYVRRLMTRDAGEMFLKFAEEFPDDPLAKIAADNAVRSYSTLVAELVESHSPVSAELRERFIVAMELLLGKWGDDPEFGDWYFHLGWQNQKLADTLEDGEARTECLKKAIAAYGKVPAGSMYALDAEYWSLGIRRTLLGEKAEPADARALVGEFQRFAAKAREASAAKAMEAPTDKESRADKEARAKELMEWGAECAFMAQEVRYSLLGEKNEARAELRKLGEQWPGTAVLKRAAEFEILQLFAENNIDEAGKAIRQFQAQYPREATELIQMLIPRIRARIDSNRSDPKKAEQLDRDRKTYVTFAKSEYERALQENMPASDLYYYKQMYADSLVESANMPGVPAGVIDQGLALFNELVAYNEEGRKEKAAVIDKEYAEKLKDIELVSSNPQKIMAYKDEYFKRLDDLGINMHNVVTAVKLQEAVKYYDEAGDDAMRQERLKDVVDRLTEAYERLQELEKNSLPVDAGNYIGFARAYRLKKEYPKAVEYYQKLIEGLDPNISPREYWSITLEMCRCVLEANRDNKEGLQGLLDYMRTLRTKDANMGGLNSKFNAVTTEAETLLGK